MAGAWLAGHRRIVVDFRIPLPVALETAERLRVGQFKDACRRMSAAITPSRASAEAMVNIRPEMRDKLTVIYNGVPVQETAPSEQATRTAKRHLGLPARPLPKGWRLYHRSASNFGHYVGDPVVNYSAPMPRDFKKAQEFMTDGAMFNKDGSRKPQRSGKCHPWFEFAPWHDTHT